MKEGVVSSARAGAPPRIAWLPATLLLLALATFLLRLAAPLNHDVAFTLIGAERLLEGGRFGVDVVDPNPPLSWWIALVPVALARFSGVGVGLAADAFAIGLALASLALTRAVLERSSLGGNRCRVLLMVAGAVLLLSPGYQFGQREHLMLIGALPWVAAVALAAEGKRAPLRIQICVGLVAGLAFCLKPHFLLVPIALELWLCLRSRHLRSPFRIEAWVLAVTGFAYAAAIFLLAPSYLETVVPNAAAVYWAFDSDSRGLWVRFAFVLLPALAAGVILRRDAARVSPLAAALIVGSFGAFAAALLQAKGWDYHWIPGLGLAAIAAAALHLDSPRWKRPRAIVAAAGLVAIIGTFGTAASDASADLRGGGTAAQVGRLAAAIRSEGGAGASVFAFITSPRDVHPALIASGARWTDPACCVQWLPASVRAGALGTGAAAKTRAVAAASEQALLARLERNKPDLVLVDNRPGKLGFGGRRFDYLVYFRAAPRFRAFWSGYEERPAVSGYRIFRRKA